MKKPNALDVMASNSATGNTQLDKAREAGSGSELKPRGIFGIRHLQCFLIFVGLAVAYGLRVNMSVAIVAMTDKSTNTNFDEYAWNEKTKSMILSSFFWGYVLTQIPGGYLCQKYGAKYILLFGVGIGSALGVLTPICASIGNWQLVCVLRFIQGFCQGCVFPGAHSILSTWAPAKERARLGTFVYSGTQFGSVAVLAMSGFIASSPMGWPGIFYISGLGGLVWSFFWYYYAASSPSEHKTISVQEKRLIEESLGKTEDACSTQLPIPWSNMAKSVPFLSLVVVHSTHTWGFWTLLTEIPTYMSSVLNLDIRSNALLSALPYFVMMLLCFVFVVLAELLNKKGILSTAASRKVFNTIGHCIPAIGLIVLGYVGSDNRNLAIALLTMTVGINSAAYLGFQVNHIDLSPNFASTMMGITNCGANIMSVCGPLAVGFLVTDEEYPWDEKTKSIILSSFFWGYVVTQIPAGHIAQRYGAKLVVLYGVFICALLNILTPWCARMGGWPLICAFRVIQGLCQGCIFPSTHTLISKWAPVEERGKLVTFTYAGTQFGTALMLALSGEMAASKMGWPSIFYFSGGAGILWTILWYFIASSSPSESRFISEEEKRYIETSQGKAEGEKKKEKLPTPWKDILTSAPFLVLLGSHCANNWGFWTLLTEIPTYMKNVLGMDIKSNALLSSLPYLAMCLLSFFFVFVSHLINRRNCMSLSFSRKFFNSLGLWVPMIGLICLGYIDGDKVTLAIILLTLTVGMNGACYLGFQVNHIDLSPNFAGTLMGTTNCAANVMSIIAPLTVGFIVHDETDPNQWRIIFFIAAGFFLVGNLLFVIFGKTETQYWNEPKAVEKKNTTTNGQNLVYMESQN